uniref:Uncharacterized protein n=1 Tax=Meloidogyne floridensis TaxID=298350 RepID=A0A915NJU6_9BILA
MTTAITKYGANSAYFPIHLEFCICVILANTHAIELIKITQALLELTKIGIGFAALFIRSKTGSFPFPSADKHVGVLLANNSATLKDNKNIKSPVDTWSLSVYTIDRIELISEIACADRVTEIIKRNDEKIKLHPELKDAIANIWADPIIQKEIAPRGNEFNFNESCP